LTRAPRARSIESSMRLLALLLALAACKPSPPADGLPFGNVLVSSAELLARPEIALSQGQVREMVKQQLQATGRFAPKEGAPAQVTLSIERAQRMLAPAAIAAGSGETPDREVAEVTISLELLQPLKGGDYDRLLAEGVARRGLEAEQSLDPAARKEVFSAALEGALHDAAMVLREEIDARHKTDEQLIADLASTESRTRGYAITALGERRVAAAVTPLIGRLGDPEPELAQRAVGALISIGDRRAVSSLIESTRHRRPEDIGPILYAIGSIGGQEAEAYLFTLESGAPDELVRRAARGAYADLLRKKQDDAARRSTNP
jgi:hypothetical protein